MEHRRVMQPPGGAASDLFGANNEVTPRKVVNRMASDLFGQQNGHSNGHTNGNSPKPKDKTFDRLFGENETPLKQKEKPYLASTLSLEDTPTTPTKSPTKSEPGSPQNGEVHINGTNGLNGSKTPELVDGPMENGKPRVPPGGFSSKLW